MAEQQPAVPRISASALQQRIAALPENEQDDYRSSVREAMTAGRVQIVDDRPPEPQAQPGASGEAAAQGANAAAKGFGSVVLGGEAAGEVGLGAAKGIMGTGYGIAKLLHLVQPNEDFEKFLESKSAPEFAGKAVEQGAEFALGEGAAKAGLKVLEKVPAIEKVVEGAPKILQWGGRIARRFGSGYGVARAQGAESGDAALAGGLNAGLPAVLEVLGGAGKMIGTKILNATIRPTATDLRDGYQTGTIIKEGLDTANLASLHESTVSRLNELNDAAKAIRGGARGGANVDVLQHFMDARDELLADPRNIGKIDAIKRVAEKYVDNLSHLSPSGSMDVVDANRLKTGLGFAGEWAHGTSVPDAEAESLFASKAYKFVNGDVTAKVGAEGPRLMAINQRIQQLIPVERAVARRLPIEARNNPLGLFKALALTSGHYGMFLADVAQKSTRVGGAALRGGSAIAAGAGDAGAGAAGMARAAQEGVDEEQPAATAPKKQAAPEAKPVTTPKTSKTLLNLSDARKKAVGGPFGGYPQAKPGTGFFGTTDMGTTKKGAKVKMIHDFAGHGDVVIEE